MSCRYAARVSDELVSCKLELGKRGRECGVLQGKIAFVERVNGELRALLEALEAENVRRQSAHDAQVRCL